MSTDYNRAKAVIVEIIRQAGGTIQSKTRLFKAFWMSHVRYHELGNVSPLTRWPIARLPHGPGIDDFDVLAGKLLEEGVVKLQDVTVGEYAAMQFSTGDNSVEHAFTSDEMSAIQCGVEYINGKTAKKVSDDSHAKSRAWQGASNGDVIDIFADSMTAEEWNDAEESYAKGMKVLKSVVSTA